MKSFIARFVLLPVSVIFLLSCNDDSSELHKEKEMRLLRQYLDSKNIETEPLSSGLYFISTGEGAGAVPQKDDWVVVRYTARLINDRIFDTTDESLAVKNNIYSTSVLYGDRRIEMKSLFRGAQEGLQLMKEGGTAKWIIPSHLAYGNKSTATIPAYSTLIYDIELVRVIKDPEAYEQQLINDYLALYNHADSAHLVIEKIESSGIYYIELFEGAGETHPEDSDKVHVYYTGSLTDGRVFESNVGGTPYIFAIGSGSSVTGFEEGVKLMKSQGRARVLLPSSTAYGPAGSGSLIAGYTPLVFELHLAKIE